uniref:Carbonic anhydrase n=1 Tax=Xenopus tropicalis TaxID=8364 RepID=A0A803K1T2_XENTR
GKTILFINTALFQQEIVRNWKHIYSECDGLQQSPVNIKTKNTTYNSLLRPFQFKGYNVTHTLPITNNGHSVQVDLPTQAHISGGGLSGVYKAKQLHFHWGSAGVAGSEHTVDGERYLMELHVVHRRNAMNEENISISNEDLAVLGFFFEVRGLPYELLQPYSIKEQFFSLGDTTCLNLTLQEFIPEPKDLALYYRYQGSLTTPPCSEIVTWTLVVPFTSKTIISWGWLFIGRLNPINVWSYLNPAHSPEEGRSEIHKPCMCRQFSKCSV